jgi:hypothetical protein
MSGSRHSRLLNPSHSSNNREARDHHIKSWYNPSRIKQALSPKKSCGAMDSPTSTDNIQHPTLDPQLTSIELSDYPPTLTKHAILSLFSSFRIADIELHTGTARSFSAPLRVKIEVAGGNREAERAVRELDGRVIEGRRICVKMVETVPYERKEGVMDGIADELKVRIVSTSIFFSSLPCNELRILRTMCRN